MKSCSYGGSNVGREAGTGATNKEARQFQVACVLKTRKQDSGMESGWLGREGMFQVC